MTDPDTGERLREEILHVQLESLKLSIEHVRVRLDNRMEQIYSSHSEYDKRLRLVEETAVKFNFLLYLTMGGGLISVITLSVLLFK